jgi:glutathione S-transferase
LNFPLLFTYRRCPYAMRARMALIVGQRQVLAHEIELRNKPPTMLAVSPKGTVPVLVLPDGRVIDESLDIMHWALVGHADGQVLHTPEAQTWLARNDGPFKRLLDQYKYPQRSGVAQREVPRDEAVTTLLRDMNTQLLRTGFMAGAQASALDLALFPFVRQFAAVEPAWFSSLDLPGLQTWLAHWLDSPLFAQAMVKLPAHTPQLFPSV